LASIESQRWFAIDVVGDVRRLIAARALGHRVIAGLVGPGADIAIRVCCYACIRLEPCHKTIGQHRRITALEGDISVRLCLTPLVQGDFCLYFGTISQRPRGIGIIEPIFVSQVNTHLLQFRGAEFAIVDQDFADVSLPRLASIGVSSHRDPGYHILKGRYCSGPAFCPVLIKGDIGQISINRTGFDNKLTQLGLGPSGARVTSTPIEHFVTAVIVQAPRGRSRVVAQKEHRIKAIGVIVGGSYHNDGHVIVQPHVARVEEPLTAVEPQRRFPVNITGHISWLIA